MDQAEAVGGEAGAATVFTTVRRAGDAHHNLSAAFALAAIGAIAAGTGRRTPRRSASVHTGAS
jgi:hypothetical protein